MSAGDEKEIADSVDAVRREVEKLIATGSLSKALSTALSVPIAKDDKIKVQATQTVCSVLGSIKDTDIAKTIDGLSDEERQSAMKFVYRGMAIGGQNYTALLKWHGALYDKDGVGSILRTIVDRNL